MTDRNAHVPVPDLALREGTPVSERYDDVYFSRAGGIAETTHVFLRGNHLPERFARSPHFTIAELGFGTGLNFLVTWQAFLQHAPAAHHLHYLAIEKFPLTEAMLRDALALHPDLSTLAAQLIAALPLRLPGLHRIHLSRVTLTLFYGDVAEALPHFTTAIDAWFLDGFSPAKNAEMWSDGVFAELGRLSAPDATFATFTAAGFVRRGLAAQGFDVDKVAGYGHKREMLVGRKTGSHIAPVSPSTALVIGGGIAGSTLARALAERGVQVTVLERGAVAGGASGNTGAVLFPQLPKRWTRSAAWYFTAYDFMLRQLAGWQKSGLDFTSECCGMLRLTRHGEEEAQLRGLNAVLGLDPEIVHWVEQAEASARSGVALATGAAYFPHGTWLAPAELCRALLQHSNILLQEHSPITTCVRQGEHWAVTTAKGAVFSAQYCCIATAQEAAAFFPDLGVRVHAVGGQVSEVTPPPEVSLRTILCHKGYVIPQGAHWLIGATYHHGDDSLAVTPENHRRNLAEVASFLPAMAEVRAISGRTSLRATTPDRLPYVGMLQEGLWISAGHGSRGMLSAPLAAEVIASAMLGEQVPLTAELRAAIDPQRFLVK